MGFVKKTLNYVTEPLTGAKAAAKAQQQAAEVQAAAIRASSEAASRAAQESAAQAATAQAGIAARNAAVGAASDALATPLDAPDIQLSPTATESAGTSARKRRAQFGIGVNTGVNI